MGRGPNHFGFVVCVLVSSFLFVVGLVVAGVAVFLPAHMSTSMLYQRQRDVGEATRKNGLHDAYSPYKNDMIMISKLSKHDIQVVVQML